MSLAPIALVGPFGLPPGTVARVPRGGWLEGVVPRLRMHVHVELGGGIEVEIDAPIASFQHVSPDWLVQTSELGRGLNALRSMAVLAKGPLGCIPKTLRLIRAQFGREQQRIEAREALMTSGAIDPLDLALCPASPAVTEFRRRVAQLEAIEGGIFVHRLLEEAKILPSDGSDYDLARDAADLVVATVLTRARGEGRDSFSYRTVDAMTVEIDAALTVLVGTIAREPTFLTLERSIRCLHYAQQHRPVVVVEADHAALASDPGGVIRAAVSAGAAAVGVLVDLAVDDPVAEPIASAARAHAIPTAIGLPEAQCRDVEALLAHTPPSGVTWCAQHLALCVPYGRDTVQVKSFNYEEHERAHGGYRARASTAFVAAIRLAGGDLQEPLGGVLALAYEYLDESDRVRWSQPIVGPTGEAARALRASGYLVLPFETRDAQGGIQIVAP